MSNVGEIRTLLTALLDCDTNEQEQENYWEIMRRFQSLEAKLEAAEKIIERLTVISDPEMRKSTATPTNAHGNPVSFHP